MTSASLTQWRGKIQPPGIKLEWKVRQGMFQNMKLNYGAIYPEDNQGDARLTRAYYHNLALNHFNHARWQATLKALFHFFMHRYSGLLDLNDLCDQQICCRHYAGLQPVNLGQICGTMGRVKDFDNHFLPLTDRIRDRWVNVAITRMQNIPLEPVALIKIDQCYFVQDGHHRISVANALGERAIDAEVIEMELTDSLSWLEKIKKNQLLSNREG